MAKKRNNKNNKKQTISKAKRELVYSNNNSSDEISKLGKIILIVTGIMIVFYGITVVVTKKIDASNTAKLGKNKTKASIQYDNIVIGTMLNMDGKYYVLIEKEDDEKLEEYSNILKSIKANDEAPTVFEADLNSSFNKKYLAEEKNDSSDLNEFKVKGTTLVEIDDHKIEKVYDDYDSIKSKLNELE